MKDALYLPQKRAGVIISYHGYWGFAQNIPKTGQKPNGPGKKKKKKIIKTDVRVQIDSVFSLGWICNSSSVHMDEALPFYLLLISRSSENSKMWFDKQAVSLCVIIYIHWVLANS